MSLEKGRFVIDDKFFAVVSWASRLCGIFPVSFKKTHNTVIICTSRFWMVYGIFLLIILETIYHVAIIREFIKTEIISYRILVLSNTCRMILFAYGVLFALKRMKILMNCLDHIEKMKKNMINKLVLNSKKWRIDIMYLTFLILTLILGYSTMWCYHAWISTARYFRYLLSLFIILIGYQFITVALSIHSSLTIVNKNLQDMFTTICAECKIEDTRLQNFMKPNDLKIPMQSINKAIDLIGMIDQLYPDNEITQRITKAEEIRQITNLFASAYTILRKLNSSESFIITLQFVIFTIDITLNVQNLAIGMRGHGEYSNSTFFIILQIIWFLSHVIKMLFLVEPCYQTHEEVANTRYLIGRLLCFLSSKVDPLYDELDIFFKQLLLNNFTYSALGICDIGRSLISTIIGASTTILVLTNQF